MLPDVVRDRLQEVRLPEAGVAVDEQWVVRLCRRLRHGQRGRVREPVGRADDEEVERVLAIQLLRSVAIGAVALDGSLGGRWNG